MVPAMYFDGRTTRVHPVELSMIAGDLRVSGEGVELRVPFADIVIDERLGNAPRRLHFPGGACCEVRDLAALDRLLSTTTHRESWVDRPQHHLGWILGAVLGFVLIVPVAYQWGLPWAAAVGARRISPIIATTISNEVMNTLDAGWLQKSKVSGERQRSLLAQFDALRISADGTIPARLLFRASSRLGANAFTLPDGTIVLLDDLTNNVGDDARVMAVLAHELGHAHERHGLQMMLRGAAVGAFLTFYVGDISQLLAAAPLAVVQARYSQQFEREADDFAATLLRRHGMSPALLADVLSRLSKLRPETAKHGYLLSHPPTDERIRHLRELAR
jgi:Zn-dependent protease with chaperone function